MSISTKQLAVLGWTRLPKPEKHVFGRDLQHSDGWKIQHCGHPTALWPYLLIDPNGEWVLAGAAGVWHNPDYGCAWDSIEKAVDYVATIGKTRKELLQTCRWR